MPQDRSLAMMSAFSVELCAMKAMVESLSGLVAEHVRQSAGEARALALVEAQTIDDLCQRLQALSDLAGAVSRGDEIAEALEAVPLADLADRLGAAVLDAVSHPLDRPAAGELMLFE